jgi:CBS domain-containing protein
MEQKVRDIMTPNPLGVDAGQTLAETARIMRDSGIGVVLVVNGETLVGVVTDRDLVVRGLAAGAGPDSPVGPLCSPRLVSVTADADLAEAELLVRENAVRAVATFRPAVVGRGTTCPAKLKQNSWGCRTPC